MFCNKCGTQIADGVSFCHQCGTKIIYGAGAQWPMDASQAPAEQGNAAAVAPAYSRGMTDDSGAFRAFVDNHVRQTTKFQSAEDLISNSKPMGFVWICFGVPALAGLVGAGLVGLLALGGFFGYCATFIASGIIRTKCRRKFYGEFEGEIDIEGFHAFMDAHLKTLSPYFHECGYLDRRGGLLTMIGNAASRAAQEVTLACVCGPKKKSMATICIRPDITNPASGRKEYFVDATYRGFLIDSRASGFLAHACLIKTAPVLSATMEYYLKNCRGGNGNVLF